MIDNLVKNIDQLNQKYEKYSFMDRLEKLFAEFDHDKILISSSFGATSRY